jgi:serine protease Do
MKSYLWLAVLLALPMAQFGSAQFSLAQEPEITQPQPVSKTDKPWFVDDEKVFADFMDKLTVLAKDGKCLANEQLVDKVKSGTKAKVELTKSGNKALTPDEIYRQALPSVFILGSVHKKKEKDKEKKKDKDNEKEKGKEKQKEGDWQDGMYATAWVAAENGILVTNWHVFEELEEAEVFGATDYKGNVYPVIDFLGGDKVADVAIVRSMPRDSSRWRWLIRTRKSAHGLESSAIRATITSCSRRDL